MAMPYLSARARERLASFRDRQVGVVGLGREGMDLVRFLAPLGARIFATDAACPPGVREELDRLAAALPLEYRLGAAQGEGDLAGCNEVFVSPGVPGEATIVAGAAARGVPLTSATRLFFELCPGPIAGITGSSGKTTTTSLLGAILERAGVACLLGGNIGRPMLSRLGEITLSTWSVLELSSFQLANLDWSPRVGCVLNITPNHLDRHPDMEDYTRAKGNIVLHQATDDVAVLNADDPVVSILPHRSRTLQFSLQRPVEGAWLEGEHLMLSGVAQPVIRRTEIRLRGLHNVANVLAAAATARAIGCPPERIAEAVREFQPVPHRLEVVDTVAGVTYVNDSIATTPERSVAALRAIDEPVVLIAGGRDKHLPMEDWARLIVQRARAVVLVGEAEPLIRRALEVAGAQVPVVTATTFVEVVPIARDLARPGDAVLLSPGCTSFDEFRDYEARGEAFREAVGTLVAVEGR